MNYIPIRGYMKPFVCSHISLLRLVNSHEHAASAGKPRSLTRGSAISEGAVRSSLRMFVFGGRVSVDLFGRAAITRHPLRSERTGRDHYGVYGAAGQRVPPDPRLTSDDRRHRNRSAPSAPRAANPDARGHG